MTTSNVDTLRDLRAKGRVPEKDIEFVDSLLRADTNGGLTIGRAKWVNKLVARYTSPALGELPSMVGIVAMLDRAKATGLKFPKLWLQLPDGSPLRITVAGEKSKTPGYLTLTDGEAFRSGRYFGRISPEGRLEIGRDGDEVGPALVEILTRLANDPAGVAAEFGHLTGHCCFCSLKLQDERSVTVGYGPICAEKFGVPWGEKPTKPTKGAKPAKGAEPKAARKVRRVAA
jgi:hypothetical protein